MLHAFEARRCWCTPLRLDGVGDVLVRRAVADPSASAVSRRWTVCGSLDVSMSVNEEEAVER